MSGMIASKTGFYLMYIFIFVVGITIVANYTNVESKFDSNLEIVQDSVVAERTVKCLSKENEFGEIDESKLTEDSLRNCFGERYSFIIKLKKFDGIDKQLTVGNSNQLKQAKRYVLVDGKSAVLEVGYNAA